MAISQTRRTTLLTRAGENTRPVRISYRKESGETSVRVIEIHQVMVSRDGALIIRAWDRSTEEIRSFRVDRITSHLTLRGTYRGPMPKVTPWFSMWRATHEDVVTPVRTLTTAGDLLATIRTRITTRS